MDAKTEEEEPDDLRPEARVVDGESPAAALASGTMAGFDSGLVRIVASKDVLSERSYSSQSWSITVVSLNKIKSHKVKF